jgi:hypothetical protein
VSEAWIASKWCRDEYQLANKYNKKLFAPLFEDIALDRLPKADNRAWFNADIFCCPGCGPIHVRFFGASGQTLRNDADLEEMPADPNLSTLARYRNQPSLRPAVQGILGGLRLAQKQPLVEVRDKKAM